MSDKRPRITVIGFGRMGKKFAEVFTQRFDVSVASSRNVKDEVERIGARFVSDFGTAIATADYIFIAVPLHALDKMINRINQYVRPNTVAFDMCSARVSAEKKLRRLQCRHFGLHAEGIFGTPDFTIINYLQTKGYRFRPMSAEEHDRLNSVRGLIHFIGMVLDAYLRNKDRKLLITSKAGSFILQLIEHLRNNTPVTYKETQIDNQFTKGRRREFLRLLKEYDRRLSKGKFPFSSPTWSRNKNLQTKGSRTHWFSNRYPALSLLTNA